MYGIELKLPKTSFRQSELLIFYFTPDFGAAAQIALGSNFGSWQIL